MSTSDPLSSQSDNVDPPKPEQGTDPPPMLPSTFHGSCHCGRITYTVDVRLPVRPERPVATRCNCRICVKLGFTGIQLPSGRESFKLLTPGSLEDEGIVDYADKTGQLHRWHCAKCGVTVCAGGRFTMPATPAAEGEGGDEKGKQGEEGKVGKVIEIFGVNIVTLDQPQEGLDLSMFRIEYWDGRHDNWMAGKKDTPWPGGIV